MASNIITTRNFLEGKKLTFDEIQEWVDLGSDFFRKDRVNIRANLTH